MALAHPDTNNNAEDDTGVMTIPTFFLQKTQKLNIKNSLGTVLYT